jgi:tetratricopeptide (TPR) repeat protein
MAAAHGKDNFHRGEKLALWILIYLSVFGFTLESNAIPVAPPSQAPESSPPSKPGAPEPNPPSTPREFFNAGTAKLRAGKLREAEALLETTLTRSAQNLQPAALYNLGHVRFGQGAEALSNSPPGKATAQAGRTAAQQADDAIRMADDALGGNDVEKLVAAYVQGRGRRKELKAATEAVKRALDAHGTALKKWERSWGDFKSALELNEGDADARQNAEVLERSIAKLVDSLTELQQMANALGDKRQELGDKMKQLKGRIPAPDMPPGAPGDDDEEEDSPFGKGPEQKEGASRDGQEMKLSPEQAGWLLEGFKLDSERRLPMGQGKPGEPRDRNRPTW